MRYLIISDAASMHVYNFVKNMLMGRGFEIIILRHSIRKIPEQYDKFYKENNIIVFSPGTENDRRSILSTARRFMKKIKFMKSLGKIDVCHIHYLHRSSCLLYRLFRGNIDKLILSYWGTDILSPSSKEIKAQKKCFHSADKITVTVEHSKRVFLDRFGDQHLEKLCFGRFAAGSIPAIKEFAEKITKEECRNVLGIPDKKLCVVCGYSAAPAQHQDICIQEIAKLPVELKEKLYLIIPVQYDRVNMDYINRVKEYVAQSGCSYKVLEEYVPFERNAMLCLATDIYIHVRDTDAFSNAMKEQIYSGSLMIQGSWLVYEELEQIKAPVVKIDAFDQLHTVIEKEMNNREFADEIRLFEPLYEIFSMEAVRKGWDAIFESLVLEGKNAIDIKKG